MSNDRFDRTARAWLEDGPVTMPDRVLDAALDEIHLTPQRRAPWPAWRAPMNSTLSKAIVGIAAVLVIAVVGFNLASNVSPNDVGGPAATPTPAPSATPVVTPPVDPNFVVGPGEVTLADPGAPATVRLTVPVEWQGENGGLGVFRERSGDGPPAPAVAIWDPEIVYTDGCQWEGTEIEVGPTVDDLANAFGGLTDREVSEIKDVTFDGYPGKELEMTVPDVPFATCDRSEFRSWTNGRGESRHHQAQLERTRMIILDVKGERLFLFVRTFADTPQNVYDEIDAILASMQIEPVASEASPSSSP